MTSDAAIEAERGTDLDAAWPEIAPLLRGLHEHHVPLVGRPLLEDWEARHRRLIEATFDSPDSIVLLARRQGEAVAFANAAIRRDPGVTRESFGFIDNVYVVPELRGRHVASLLLSALERWFRERGVEEAQLSVVEANAHAVEVWRALGFETLSLRMTKRLDRAD